jgi:hypothetical protein
MQRSLKTHYLPRPPKAGWKMALAQKLRSFDDWLHQLLHYRMATFSCDKFRIKVNVLSCPFVQVKSGEVRVKGARAEDEAGKSADEGFLMFSVRDAMLI